MNISKPWLSSYPSGVPDTVDWSGYSSLLELFDESFLKFGHLKAFSCLGVSLTYQQLDFASAQFAAYLQGLGLAQGARVGIMMPNTLQYPIAVIGALRAGYVVVNINPLYTPRELEYQLQDCGAQVLVVLENFAHVYEQIQEKVPVEHVVVTSLGELMGVKGWVINAVIRHIKKLVPMWYLPKALTFRESLNLGMHRKWQVPTVKHEDIAFLQYTGGTTGVSKGAMLTHRNILANLLQIESWLQPGLKDKSIDQLVFICALPLYHIFALTACCLFGIRAGGLNILVPNPKDIGAFIKLLRGQKTFHIFPAVNTLFNALMNHRDFSRIDFSTLLVSIGGGMSVQKSVADRWQSLTGQTIAEGYGLSETSPVACCNTPLIQSYTGHVGLPLPGTEVTIRDDLGTDLSFGQRGEICIRGPQLMKGYWQKSEETSQAMMADGFFRSGDIGEMNEQGYVKIVDRKKDTILVSGFNVYPNEVEEVVSELSDVLECAAVGVADEHSGEAVKLFVVRKTPLLSEQEILTHCQERLTNYKRPKHIEFRDRLPKTNVGKILRRELKVD